MEKFPPLATNLIDSGDGKSTTNEIANDKYCLDIDTAHKSEKIKFAREAKNNELIRFLKSILRGHFAMSVLTLEI